jgi:hypothetical protein
MKTKLTLIAAVLLFAQAMCLYGQTTKLIRHTRYELRFYTKQCSSITGYHEQTAEHTAHLRQIERNSFKPDGGHHNHVPSISQKNTKIIMLLMTATSITG